MKRKLLFHVAVITAVLCFVSLQLFCQTSWTGITSNNWRTSGNWTAGVPTSSTDAVIGDANFTGSFQPVISSNASCKSLVIGSTGAPILTLNKSLTVSGNLTLNTGSTITQKNVSLTVKGNWSNSGTYTATSTNSRVNFSGSSQSISGTSTTSFRKLTINAGCVVTMNVNIAVVGTFTVNGTFIPLENATAYQVSGAGSLSLGAGAVLKVNAATFAGNYGLTGSITLAAGSIVEYNATLVNQTIKENITYSTLKISGSGTKTLAGNLNALNSTTATTGNIDVSAATLDLSTYTANRGTTVAGGTLNVANGATLKIGGTNSFPSNYNTRSLSLTGTVEYSGTNQTVSAQTYGNLVLSSTSGATIKTMPSADFTVAGNLGSNVTAGSLSFTAASNITVSGNISIGSSTTFNGSSYTTNVAGNWINNGTFSGSTGNVNMTGEGTSISGTGTQNFNNLSFGASNITASSASLAIAGNLSTTGPGSFTHNTGGTLTMSGTTKTITGVGITLDNLTISGSATITNLTLTGNLSVSGTLTGSGGIIILNGTGKSISGAGSISFSSLSVTSTITTASNFSVSTALDVSGSLTASAGTVTFTGSSTLNGTANLFNVTLNGTSLQLSTNAILGIAGTYSVTSGTLNVSSTTPNTVNYNGTGAQTILGSNYHHLILSNGNTKTAGGNITVNGDITINASTTFNASLYTHTVKGNWINSGTFSAGSSTIAFSGTSDVSISGASTFNSLTINKSSSVNTVSILNDIAASTVNMTNGILNTGSSNTLTISNTRTGNGIILGNIKRTHAFVTGISYAFEGPDNTITFTGVNTISSITVSVTTGTVTDFPRGGSINRVYNISVTGSLLLSVATLRLHYEDAELNGNTESAMGLWNNNGSGWAVSGKTANSTTANYVEQSNLTSISNRWTISDNANVVRWNGSVSSDWFTAANWTTTQGSPAIPPGAGDIVEIGTAAFTYQPSINNSTTVKSIVFGSVQAATLSLTTGGSLTSQGNITGSWAGNVTHVINVNNQVLTVTGEMVLSDGTNGHIINLNIGAGTAAIAGSLTETGGANITFTGSGFLNIGNNFNYSSGTFTAATSTVTYNGTGVQTVAGLSYNELKIAKAGGIAAINSSAYVGGNLTVSAGELDINSPTTIAGNVTIAAGATINGDGITTSVGGNWNNNGSFISLSGTIVLNGTGSQTVSSTTFNNLTVNKSSGNATFTGNITVNGNLSAIAGTLDLSTFTGNRSSLGGTLTVSDGVTLLVGGVNNFPVNYASYTLGTNSTVNYNGSIAQTVAGVTYGNITFSNGGSAFKTLGGATTVKGDILINSGASFGASTYTLNLNGNWNNSGSFTSSTGTVILNGSSKTISGNTTFNKVTVYGSYVANGSDLTFNGLLLVATGGSFDAGTGTATVNGDLTNNGSLTSYGTTTFTGTSVQTIRFINAVVSNSHGVINFNGTVSPVLNSTSTPTFATLNINNTAGINASVGWLVLVAFNISSGATFNGGASTHTIYGSFTNNGTVTSSGAINFTPSAAQTIKLAGTGFSSTGTVTFGGSGAMAVSGTPTSLNNVTISNTAGVTPAAGWTINGNFLISNNGVFNAGNNSFTVAGDFESNGTLNDGTSTFTLSSAAGQLSGSPAPSFYDLIITGNITANADFNVEHNFTNNNTIDASIGALVMTGSLAGTITGSASSYALAQITVNKTSSAIVTLGKNITGVLELDITGGTLDMSTNTVTQDASGGILSIDDNASLVIRGTNSLPVFTTYTLDTLSTVEYAGTTQAVSSSTSYGNLTISSTGTKTASAALNILNNFSLTNGTFVAGNYTDTLGGNWSMASGTFTNTGNTILLTGTGTQNISSTGSFNNLTLNKPSGFAVLSSNITVGSVLKFTSGKIQTGSYVVVIPSTGSVSGALQTTGWVFGKIQKNIATGSNVTRTFELGDSSYYMPSSVVFASVTTAGNLTGGIVNTDHPNLSVSGINTARSVNCYWPFSNGGTVFTTVSVTVNWVASKLDAGAVTSNFKVGNYNGSTWSLPTVASALSTSIQATGLSVIGDIAVGELSAAFTWTGTVSNNWHTAGNWSSGSIPLTTSNVIIPAGLSVYPTISTGTATANDLTIQSGASITVSSVTLQISGNVVNNGTFTHNSSTILFAGNTQTLSGSSQAVYNNITVASGSSTTFSTTGQSLQGILLSNGTLNANGNLTLLSTATQTALVDGSGAGEVTGNITMQRYLASGYGYKYLSSPFQAATVNELADDINLSSSFPSLYRYDENQSVSGWVSYTNTSGLLNPLQGYAANFGSSAVAKTVNITGVVNNHTIAATLYNHNKTFTLGFNLVGNPYPSPVDWDAAAGWSRTNIDNAIYFFNAGTTSQYKGTYSSYINGISSDGTAGNIIAAMQGFFVHVSNGSYPVTAGLSVNNGARVNNSSAHFYRHSNMRGGEDPIVRIKAGFASEGIPCDPVVVYFDNIASNGFDRDLDALKLMNTNPQVPSLYAVSSKADKLSINALPVPDSSTVVPLSLVTERAGWVTFNTYEIERVPAALHIYFVDAKTGMMQDVRQKPEYSLQLEKDKYENRFSLIFSRKDLMSKPPAPPVVNPGNTTGPQGDIIFNAYSTGEKITALFQLPTGEKGSLVITDIQGRPVVKRDLSGAGKYQTGPEFISGVYIVSFYSQKKTFSKKLFIGGN